MNDKEKIKAELKVLIEHARKEKKWLFCGYQCLWFTPDELETANNSGKFLWGTVNWTLRDPQEKIDEIQKQIDELGKQLAENHTKLFLSHTGEG